MILPCLKNCCFHCLRKADRFISNLFIGLIILFRPLLGPEGICPLKPGCTQFALRELEAQYLYISLPLIGKRLLGCNPLSIWMNRTKS